MVKFHEGGKKVYLKELRDAEEVEIRSIPKQPLYKYIRKTFKIRVKYWHLRNEEKYNNYGNDKK